KYELEIVGRGPDERTLQELASRLGVAHEIRFSGSLDRAAVAQRYRDAHLFTLPSSAEAFGNVFAEALASGLPVVGSNVGGIPELIEHGVNGLLVTPGNPGALAQAIQYLADDPELRSEMSVRNRAKAEATLEWSHVVKRYLSIYEGVMHQLPVPQLVTEPTVSAL
ncbi:MAG TPA: glycosyltransferase family 4 protein, partial [Gemmatimonadales bacterium]